MTTIESNTECPPDVWAEALRVWKSEDAARDFLQRAHPLLGMRRPIDVIADKKGARLVKLVLGRLEAGSVA